MGGKGGSMHLTERRARHDGLVRHRRRAPADRASARPGRRSTAARARSRSASSVTATTNIGAFHEALNLAAVWKLPVVFVCENNLYMEYTPIGAVTAVPRPAADRAAAYGLRRHRRRRQRRRTRCYADRARDHRAGASRRGPSLIEALTYRHGGHSRADPGKYRPRERGQGVARSATRSRATASALVEAGVDGAEARRDRGGRRRTGSTAAEAEARAARPSPASA